MKECLDARTSIDSLIKQLKNNKELENQFIDFSKIFRLFIAGSKAPIFGRPGLTNHGNVKSVSRIFSQHTFHLRFKESACQSEKPR